MEYSGSAEKFWQIKLRDKLSATVAGAPKFDSGSSFILSAYSLSTLCLLPDKFSGGIVTLLPSLVLSSLSLEEDYAHRTLSESN